MAANPQTKPTALASESTSRLLRHRHLLELLSLKADIHFTVPRRVEG